MKPESVCVQAEAYDYGQVIGVSYPVLATTISVDNSISEKAAEYLAEPISTSNELSLDNVDKASDETVYVEAICTGTIVDFENEFEKLSVSDSASVSAEICLMATDSTKSRSRCTSAGSNDTQFYMDVIDILKVPNETSNFMANEAVEHVQPVDENADYTSFEAEEIGRILEACAHSQASMDSFDASVFDSIERDIDCIHLDECDFQSSHPSSSPVASAALPSDQESPSSVGDSASSIAEEVKALFAAISTSHLKLISSSSSSCSDCHRQTDSKKLLLDKVHRAEEREPGFIACRLLTADCSSQQPIIVSTPPWTDGYRCHFLRDAVHLPHHPNRDNKTDGPSRRVLLLDPVEAFRAPSCPSVSLQSKDKGSDLSSERRLDPRKIATSKRIRDGGKFKRVQTKWISATDFFSQPRGAVCPAPPSSASSVKGRKRPSKKAIAVDSSPPPPSLALSGSTGRVG